MDFFERQERSRRTSRFLVGAFALAFAAVVLATTGLATAVIWLYLPLEYGATFGEWLTAHGGLVAAIAAGTLLAMLLACLYRTASLAGGGGRVARLLGGSEISGDVSDLPRRRLLNVAEEMAIASGLPMPEIFVLEREPGINAFAAGTTPGNAAIAVTRGALEQLDRAELQGVIAHEMSHIVNGDMRLNQRLIGLSFGILVLSLIGRWLLRAARFDRRGRSSGAALAALALGAGFSLIGGIGLLLSRLIKAGVSRERERLADASAVQFTREPGGLASALKKIGGYGSRLASVDSEEVAHMLFEHAGPTFRGWLATHPPIEERIRALDPTFDPAALERKAAAPIGGTEAGRATVDRSGTAGLAVGGTMTAPLDSSAARTAAQGIDADDARDEALLERAGTIGSVELAARLHAALPPEIYDAAHSRESSLLLVPALVLSQQEPVRAAQRALLEAQLGTRRAVRCETFEAALAALDPSLRLPLLDLALPALKQRPVQQIEYLFELVRKLIDCGGEQRLFDYVLLRMLAAYLDRDLGHPAEGATAAGTKLSTRAACGALLAAVAAFGHEDAESARAAYAAGCASIRGGLPEPDASLVALRDIARLDAALARLAKLAPRAKKTVLAAVLATIRHDRHIGVEEAELFRAIAAALGIPVPPTPLAAAQAVAPPASLRASC